MMRVREASERKKERAARWSGPKFGADMRHKGENVLNKST